MPVPNTVVLAAIAQLRNVANMGASYFERQQPVAPVIPGAMAAVTNDSCDLLQQYVDENPDE